MKRLLLIFGFFTLLNANAQNSQLYFSEAIDVFLPEYLANVEKAISNMQKDKINTLFETLVEEKLSGSLMNNFTVKNLAKKDVQLSDFEKPVLLLTYSSWRLSCKGELPALNELADHYGDQIKIVLLFWGEHKKVKELAKGYHKNIDILYVDDADNNYTLIIKNLKHSFGLPLAYTLTSQYEIVDIKKRLSNEISESKDEASLENYELYKNAITSLFFEEAQLSHSPIVINK
ncbi:TlpA family protein disulfide reductase [Dokdonia sp. Hel_I_53]|uniref:TlpA family protein disulfide reductase n=1 Tax=Dokdonia sp. Hel_I_53 TaxID=1566287 RepID=UPI00119958BD|nr:redoxin domain-containing protein [Dokdonia sp. Hel_I_53]TVZ51747.1 AhpC/TSA family protein [Dokdonia sp. Hel_I_53]